MRHAGSYRLAGGLLEGGLTQHYSKKIGNGKLSGADPPIQPQREILKRALSAQIKVAAVAKRT